MFSIGKEYRLNDIDSFIIDSLADVEIAKNNKKIRYYNCPCSFDIETTSFYDDGLKTAIMYEWTLGINGNYVIGRTWQEFARTYSRIVELLGLNEELRLMIYVHNFDFEFAFLQFRLEWDKVFSIDNRKPVYALTIHGIEFRCSYKLSGYSLAKLGDQLLKYKVRKMVGDLDYSLMRHSNTPLTDKEKQYCINDVMVVMCFIQERIEEDGDITKIPLTNTGYVRKYCRNICLYGGNKSHKKTGNTYLKYRRMMSNLTLDKETYLQSKRAFQGGFVHANIWKVNKILKNIWSFDEVSAYPAMLVAKMYPMGKAVKCDIKSREDLEYFCDHYCCMFDIEFKNIESKIPQERYISSSKCWNMTHYNEDNGRIIRADSLCTTITEQDYFIICKFYKWSGMRVTNFKRFRRAYLPTPFIESVLKLYVDKTELKGVIGKELEYMNSKGRLNACYGMMVTDICRDTIVFDHGWQEPLPCDIEECLERYNKDNRRFTYYLWGLWVTAYARTAIAQAIVALGDDYVYSDTDSAKFCKGYKHFKYFESYNKRITEQLERACIFHNIDVAMIRPKNKKGEEKPLGIFECEGYYQKFKTLGAKRYAFKREGKYNIVVAGLGKKGATKFLNNEKGYFLDNFKIGLYVPPQDTGKMTHEYIDTYRSGTLTDYLGNKCAYEELSGVHLESCDYTMSVSEIYADLILNAKECEQL